MTCKDCQKLIEKYLEGSLAASEPEALESHARECLPCRRALEAARRVQDLVREGLAPGTQPSQAAEAVLSRIAQEPLLERPAVGGILSAFRWPRAAAAAGILLLGLVIGLGLARVGQRPRPGVDLGPPLALAIEQLEGAVLVKHRGADNWEDLRSGSRLYLRDLIQTLPNSTVALKLRDGSTIALGADSSLVLEASDGVTELALRWGTAHASLVSPHPPFFIRTPQARIEALGTEFTVSVR